MTYFRPIKKDGNLFFSDPKPEPKERAKPKPIPARSKKRAEDNKEYLIRRDIYLASNKFCEAKTPVCTKHSVEIHHTFSGKDRDKYFLVIETWKAVCIECHQWIHKFSKKARELGLLK
jgi:hypothetical protein